MRTAILVLSALAVSGCSGGGARTDAAASSGAATGSGGSGPMLPVTSCPTESMVALYPGEWPPDPMGPKPPATACVAAPHDVIIVLGCPNNDDGTPSACQTARADIAVGLMNAGFGQRFITSGAAVHNAYVEADTLKGLLTDRGVPDASIWTEDRAQHTDENIYYSTEIMAQQGWTNALVVSEDPAHLVLTGLCDSNCCVDLGRLTVFEFPLAMGQTVLAGHYALYPWTKAVSKAECAQIEIGTKFMCVNLPTRRACAGNLRVPP